MKNHQIISKTLVAVSVILLITGLYLAIGFFMDLFFESSPILLLILLIVPLIYRKKKKIRRGSVIAVIIIFSILSASLFTTVGVIANSKPDNNKQIVSGTEEKFTYTNTFMENNYNINQKTVIKVWIPSNYSEENSYPVIYILDGDMLFHSAEVYASKRSAAGEGDIIVVGIGYGYWNSTFARGGLSPNVKELRGRWRDFTFADDSQLGYLNVPLGGEQKRGFEYTSFITNTVVKDIRSKYSTDPNNSTILGHSLGGGLSAYFLTQYNPLKGSENPFTNFIIADNAYTDYYKAHLADWIDTMEANANSAYSQIKIYRIWGGTVNTEENDEQYKLYTDIRDLSFDKVSNYFDIPQGANHNDTQTISIYNAINLALGKEFEYQTEL